MSAARSDPRTPAGHEFAGNVLIGHPGAAWVVAAGTRGWGGITVKVLPGRWWGWRRGQPVYLEGGFAAYRRLPGAKRGRP